jgi:UDP:flavonoid glycosyltransferase YjiC (YdhE family)
LDSSCVAAFLLPQRHWDFFRRRGADVLNIDHDELKTQMIAHAQFKPDVVVDDLSFTTAFARQVKPFPRVTIQRTGSFPGEMTPAPDREHSAAPALKSLPDLSRLGLAKPTRISDLVTAEAVIVPGIRSVEVLPPHLHGDPRYFFSGPLVIDDSHPAEVEAFLARHAAAQIVLFTFGTIARASPHIEALIVRLLEQGRAVISTVAVAGVAGDRSAAFFHGEFLPLQRICARAALMIHHCGSGTSQYPVLFNLPSITLSTGCHDREDVALRLQSLGASRHLDRTVGQAGYDTRFDEAVQTYLDPTSQALRSARAVLSRLKQEAQLTAAAFDFPRVLEHARSSRTGGRARRSGGSRPEAVPPSAGRR